jgi:hypothetical protein
VLVVSSLTGAGLPELLAAIDRRAPDPASAASARLARARTQVLGILGERLRERLLDGTSAGAMEAVVADVAAHRLDPYAAADRLLSTFVTGQDRRS